MSYLEFFIKQLITAIGNIGLKYIYVLLEFKHTELLSSHRGYFLNTTLMSDFQVQV